jgi:hypothetical protein
MIGATIPKVARTAIRWTESTQLPFIAGIIATLGTLPAVQRAAEAILFVRFKAFTVTTGALGLRLAQLIGVADRFATAAYPALRATSIGPTIFAFASGLAETFSIGVTGEALVTLPATPATTIGTAIPVAAVWQTLPGTGINKPLAQPQSLLHETGTLRLPIILALGNYAPENLFDIVANANGQGTETFHDTIDLSILTGGLKGTSIGGLARPLGPGATLSVETRSGLMARLRNRPAAPIFQTVGGSVALTQSTSRLASPVRYTDVGAEGAICCPYLWRQVHSDHVNRRAITRTCVQRHNFLDPVNCARQVNQHRVSAP